MLYNFNSYESGECSRDAVYTCSKWVVDIFPNEIPGLPRKREVEFVIDLVFGALPILMAPYIMTPTKLSELKK